MKTKTLLSLCFVLFLFGSSYATETEPNDTRAQANTLTLNGSNSGVINPGATDVDWFKVATTSDGNLSVTLTVSNSLFAWFAVYDNNGTTLLNQENTNGAKTYTVEGLAAGTYYIKIYPYYAGQMPAYNISNALTAPAQANDAEPNDTKALALTLPLNSSKTGHVDYLYNNHRDSADWYKVTTNGDGRLRLRLTSGNGQFIWAYLFDNNGTTQLNAENTNGTRDINTDGLAAGTYYIRVNSYYNNGFVPYTLADSLFQPSETNDAEPNNTRAQALVLPLNGSVKGHSDYYYNNNRDSADWYKVTTNGDGRLRLRLTSGNGQFIWAYLFDNNGTTQLNAENTNGTKDINTDGLAAGTYYIRINSYYNNGFVPYTLADSLFKPSETNDAEPNNTKAVALVLPLNGSVKGHSDYYYNNNRDSADWYKLTTNADGRIRLRLTSGNGQFIWAYLYDNDGVTQLDAQNTNSTKDISNDGLAAGTYYIRVKSYYNNGFVPYTLSDSLFTYNFANDGKVNERASQAATLPSNNVTPGHVGFYYNNRRDSVDWWKINYTGTSGTLTVTLNLEPEQCCGISYTWMYIYKDTLAAPLYAANTNTASLVANLTALTQGYYWVKVIPYYNTQFEAYTLTPTFTQVNKATIQVIRRDTAAICDSTNAITFRCGSSRSPYSVQLYRYGIAYGSPRSVPNALNFQITNLPQGSYYARAFGDGATGSAYGQSAVVNFVPRVAGTSTTDIAPTSAKTNWAPIACAKYYTVQYHKSGESAWLTKNSTGNTGNTTLTGLLANTTYKWRVQAVDSGNNITAKGAFTDSLSFTTTTGGSALPDTLEAEDALLIGPAVASNQPGFTGTGFADYQNASGDYIEWTFNAATAGSFSLKFRYANGGATNRPLQLAVNGVVVNAGLPFAPTGSFATWSASSDTANLIAGDNKIRLTTIGSNGPNVDHLVVNTVISQTTSYEAEDAFLSGPAVASNQPGFTGTGFADYKNASGDYIEWTVNATAAGSFSLQFRYANGGATDRPLQLLVNGAVVNAGLPFAPTGSFATWSVSSHTANLITGVNIIRLTTTGSNGPNVDHLVISNNTGSPIQSVQRPARGKSILLPASPGFLRARVTPNPVQVDNAKLIVSTSLNLPISFQLVDVLGRSHQSLRLMKSGSNTFDFSVNGLPAGSYIIIIKQGNLSTNARLIVGGK